MTVLDLSGILLLPVAILGTVAACFWLVALVLCLRALVSGSRGVRVQGRVVGFSDSYSRRRRMYSAIYEATVPDGRTLRCTSGIAKSWKSPAEGTVVTLAYRSDDPKKPLATLGWERFLFAGIFAGVAAVLTSSAISLFLKMPTPSSFAIPTAPSRSPISIPQPRR
jgi:hypothetical protein